MNKPRRNLQERLQIVQRYIDEGRGDIATFCASLGMKPSSFDHWLREYRKINIPAEQGKFVRVDLQHPHATQGLNIFVGSCRVSFSTLPPVQYLSALLNGFE